MEKETKSAAQYQERHRAGQHCSLCVMFIAPDRCSKVEGVINSFGWCREYYPAAKGSILHG